MDFILDFFVSNSLKKTWLLWLQELYCKKYWDISHWKFCKILGIPSFTVTFYLQLFFLFLQPQEVLVAKCSCNGLIYRCHKIM